MLIILLVILVAIVSFMLGGFVCNQHLIKKLEVKQKIVDTQDQMIEKYNNLIRINEDICEKDKKLLKYYKTALAFVMWNPDAE